MMALADIKIPDLLGERNWTDWWVRGGWRVQRQSGSNTARLVDEKSNIVASGDWKRCQTIGEQHTKAESHSKSVILLHGMGNHRSTMRHIEEQLRMNGWSVANVGYASLRDPISEHRKAIGNVAHSMFKDGAHRIHWVGFSLGGLVARASAVLAQNGGWQNGKIVLIGSPSTGARMAGLLNSLPAIKNIAGPSFHTVTREGAASVPVPHCDGIGVIAGGNGNSGFNPLLIGDNDGVVSVDETRLPGSEKDFLLVRSIHTSLPSSNEVVNATLHFLEQGRLRSHRKDF